ncbi:collagen-like triple helix repeat-containing protein [Vibrio furnissii]|uniref:collagen-like triple helix repeat-containing protein n=1 Tax=Vibrio furnissii TaxID=29494 RepID=UPI003AA86608
MSDYDLIKQEVVTPVLSASDPQLSLGQNGPETIEKSKIFVQRLDIHDVVTIKHPDGSGNPVAILCDQVFFHTNGIIQSDSEIIFFSDYAEGFIAIQNTKGTHAKDMEPIQTIPDPVPGTAAQGGTGAKGRNADFDPPFTNHSARSGGAGGTGAQGAQGHDGFTTQNRNNGEHANDITIFVKQFHPDSILEISARGGDGGDGAKGGTGGQGQQGGKGGTGGEGGHGNSLSPAKRGGTGGAGGKGGTGGTGGRGGPGGDGGNGGDILIYALDGHSLGIIEIINNKGGFKGIGGQGGDGGKGGNPGKRGDGGKGGDGAIFRGDGQNGLAGSKGSLGQPGNPGRPGDDGENGIDGDVRHEARQVVGHVSSNRAKQIALQVVNVA